MSKQGQHNMLQTIHNFYSKTAISASYSHTYIQFNRKNYLSVSDLKPVTKRTYFINFERRQEAGLSVL